MGKIPQIEMQELHLSDVSAKVGASRWCVRKRWFNDTKWWSDYKQWWFHKLKWWYNPLPSKRDYNIRTFVDIFALPRWFDTWSSTVQTSLPAVRILRICGQHLASPASGLLHGRWPARCLQGLRTGTVCWFQDWFESMKNTWYRTKIQNYQAYPSAGTWLPNSVRQ